MIGGVPARSHKIEGPKAADDLAARIKTGERSKRWIGALVAIRIEKAGQPYTRRADIGNSKLDCAQILFHLGNVATNVTIAEVRRHDKGRDWQDRLSRRRREVVLETLQVYFGVGSNVGRSP